MRTQGLKKSDRLGKNQRYKSKIHLANIVEDAASDSALVQAANANPSDKFALVFGGHVQNLMVERMEQNEEIFGRYMSAPDFRQVVNHWLAQEVYGKLTKPLATSESTETYRAPSDEG